MLFRSFRAVTAVTFALFIGTPVAGEEPLKVPVRIAQANGFPSSSGGITSGASERNAATYIAPDERVAHLEAELAKVTARLAAMEQRFNNHSHEVNVTGVGLLSEPINGRRVPLAISPHAVSVRSGPPVQ